MTVEVEMYDGGGAAGSAKRSSARQDEELAAGPDDKHRAIAYYDGLGAAYEDYTHWGPLSYFRRRERAIVLALLDLPRAAGGTLLDVGCGAGYYARAAQRAGLRVCAVDAAPSMVAAVAPFVSEAHVADIDHLDSHFDGGRTWDRVLCAGVLDFLHDPESALRRLCALTTAGGRLVVLAPRRSLGGYIYRFEKRFRGLQANLFTHAWFERVAARAGCDVVDSRKATPNSIAVAMLHRSK